MLSVIIPIYNEAENLIRFIPELDRALSKLSSEYELLAINDGSTDESMSVLTKLKKKYLRLKILSLRKNFGKSAAYLVGFTKAKGDIILTIDSDGQDMPEEIPKLLTVLKKGYQVVVGWRKKRSDPAPKKFSSFLWNKVLSISSGIKLHDVNCGLKAFRHEVLNSHYFRGDFHRYLPVIIAMDGYKATEVEVSHRKRLKGTSKYNYSRFFPALFDYATCMFLARFGFKPMHLFGSIGFFIFMLGMLINFYLLLIKLTGESIGGRPLLILGLLFTLAGLQLVFTGFLGDLIIRREDLSPEDYLLT